MFNNTLLLHLPPPIPPSLARWVVSLFVLSNSLMWPNREKKMNKILSSRIFDFSGLILNNRQWLTDSASFNFNLNIDNFHSFVDPFDFDWTVVEPAGRFFRKGWLLQWILKLENLNLLKELILIQSVNLMVCSCGFYKCLC